MADQGAAPAGAAGAAAAVRTVPEPSLHERHIQAADVARSAQISGVRAVDRRTRAVLASTLITHRERLASSWASLLVVQRGTMYHGQFDGQQSEGVREAALSRTLQNTASLLAAFASYVESANETLLRKSISALVQTRTNEGFGPAEIASSMFLFRPALMMTCGNINPEISLVISVVTRLAVSLVYEMCMRQVEDLSEDVRPPAALFLVVDKTEPTATDNLVRITPRLWSRSVNESAEHAAHPLKFPRGEEPLINAVVDGKYVVRRYLANGSFGHGWQATEIRSQRDVFLKTMRAEHDTGCPKMDSTGLSYDGPTLEHARQEMTKEMNLMRRLKRDGLEHDGLVKVHDTTAPHAPRRIVLASGLRADIHFAVADLCGGGDLYEYICVQPLRPFDEEIVAHMMRQVISALAYLHKRHFAHRDLKCENLLVSSSADGRMCIKISDFGRMVYVPPVPNDAGDAPAHLEAQFEHGINVMPPEAFVGGRIGRLPVARTDGLYDVGPADIWALGAVAVYLLGVGRLYPIQTRVYACLKALDEAFLAGGSDDEEPFDRLRRHVPAHVWPLSEQAERMLRDCFRLAPEQRPTAEQLLRDYAFLSAEDVPSEERMFTALEERRAFNTTKKNSYTIRTVSWSRKQVFEDLKAALCSLPGVRGEDIHADMVTGIATARVPPNVVRAQLGYEQLPEGVSSAEARVVVHVNWSHGTDFSAFVVALATLQARLGDGASSTTPRVGDGDGDGDGDGHSAKRPRRDRPRGASG